MPLSTQKQKRHLQSATRLRVHVQMLNQSISLLGRSVQMRFFVHCLGLQSRENKSLRMEVLQ